MRDDTESIWKEFSSHLRRFILKRVQNEDDAEDILQIVFLKIHQNIVQLKERDKLRAWIYQIARNAIIEYYRNKQPVIELSEIPEPLEDELSTASNTAPELDLCIKPLINHLPKKYRQAIILDEFDCFTQKKIAERLGLSLPGAKSRVQRARKKLKEIILECCSFEYDRLGNIIDYQSKENCPCE